MHPRIAVRRAIVAREIRKDADSLLKEALLQLASFIDESPSIFENGTEILVNISKLTKCINDSDRDSVEGYNARAAVTHLLVDMKPDLVKLETLIRVFDEIVAT